MTEIQLLLEDYTAQLRVGILPHERAAPQRVRVKITVQLKKPPRRDDINQTFDYGQIITEIETLAEKHFNLLETFAATLAKKLLKNKRLVAIDIELMKLDIFENGNVGLRYRFTK